MSIAFATLFDSRRVDRSPIFAVPLLPALVHEDSLECEDCGVVHSFNPPLPPIDVDSLDPPLTAGDRGYRAAFSGLSRDMAPTGPARREWLDGYEQLVRERGERRAPDSFTDSERRASSERVSAIVGAGDARRSARKGHGPTVADQCWGEGLFAASEADGEVDPPAECRDPESFRNGVARWVVERDNRLSIEADVEMASVWAD